MKPFPGKPQAQLQAVSTALWDGRRIVAYIAGNALIILGGPNDLIQTINHGEDDRFTAVAIHDITGKIAASTKTSIVIYKPFGHDFGAPKWSLEHSFTCEAQETSIYSLSWGFAEELLAGGSALTLFSTGENGRRLWTRSIANPVKFAALSPDGSFIATSGWHDRLVKIWRRLYFSEENERFDVSYLPHSSAVTELRWHGRRDPEYHAEAILYTTSADCKLKVWAATDPHGLQALQLWAEMDLTRCMLPEIEQKEEYMRRKYLFIVDNWEYEALVERVTHRSSNTEKDQETLKKLVDVAYRDPDICVILDDQGNMSAWGLERVGCKARQANDVFKIAQMTGIDVNALAGVKRSQDYATCLSFGGLGDGCEVNLLINFFDGRLQWLTCPIDRLFYAEPGTASFTTEAVFTGHTEIIEAILTDATKTAVSSRSAGHEVVLWNLRDGTASTGLQRVGFIPSNNSIRIALPVSKGQYALTVDEREVSLWDTRRSKAVQLSSQRLPADFEASSYLVKENVATNETCEVLLVSELLGGVILALSADSEGRPEYVERVCDVTPIESHAPELFSLVSTQDTDDQSCAVSVNKAGRLVSWTLDVSAGREPAVWKKMNTLETGMQDSTALCLNVNMKIVLLNMNKTLVTIWNVRDGSVEFAEQFQSHNTINHIRWTTATDGTPILALVFSHKVLFYAQLPYELHGEGSPDAWLRLREIDINDLTNLPISDLAWLASGQVVLSAGNQMFAYDQDVDRETAHGLGLPAESKGGHELFKVASAMNCTLPVFHPQSLRQLSLSGRTESMHHILCSLHTALKYFSEGDKLDSSLGIDFGKTSPHADNGHSGDDEGRILTEDNANELQERLSGLRLPHLPTTQRDELIRIVKSVGASQKQQRSVDLYGYRYLLMSHEHFSHPEKADGNSRFQLSWREIILAYHSTSQEVLIDMTSRHYKGRLLWKDARECGMFMWTTDLATLRLQFENIARNEYTKTDERNPIDCSLHYIALRKKAVLISLWRMATWNKEQSATQRLLTNNFADPKWQTTALKNAYALLGRRRFEYAAAFFLLADRPKDAASVLSAQMNDIQLAVAVTRVYEGDDGPVLKELIKDKVLPLAAQQGDRWLAHWSFDMLGRRDLAMRCLVVPLTSIINVKLMSSQVQQAAHFRNSDPALLSLYRQLRGTTVPPGQQPYPALEQVEEWDFVMKTVRTYIRAGCAALALETARTWKFTTQTAPPRPQSSGMSTATSTASTPREGQTPKPSALDAFRNGPRQQTTTLSEPPSMLDLFTMASPAMPNAQPRPNPPAKSRAGQQVPSMLEDYFSDAPPATKVQPQQAAPKPSTLDAFTDPQRAIPQRHSTPQPPPAPSMLDAFMDPTPAPKKRPPQPSMLDAFMDPVPATKKIPQQVSQPSMLDAFMDPPPATRKVPQPANQPPSMHDAFMEPSHALKKAQPPSMLDAFMDKSPSAAKTATPPSKQPPSMLDPFADPVPATKRQNSAESATTNTTTGGESRGSTTKTEEDKPAGEKEDKVPGFGEKIQRKKVEKEPDANSILDNFNF